MVALDFGTKPEKLGADVLKKVESILAGKALLAAATERMMGVGKVF
jgi:hypothetical protein